MREPLIKVRDLCKVYNPGENEVRALDHVDLSIDKGELVGIIGHSVWGFFVRFKVSYDKTTQSFRNMQTMFVVFLTSVV